MLHLKQKEFEDMENLSYICKGKPHKDVIHLILHSGTISSQYMHLSKLHKYDVLGAVLTGQYKLIASATEIYEKHASEARQRDLVGGTPNVAWSLSRFYSDLKENGFIKEDN